jgi:hypothetical protein
MGTRIIFCLWMVLAGESQAPWIGTWKLNPAKSTTNRDARYKRTITKIQPWQDGIRVTYDMVGTRGGVTHMEWTGKFDGKDYPVEGLDYILTNSYKLLGDHSYEILIKVEGGVAATARVEISPDGKTLTTVTSQRDAQGQDVTTTAVYDKQ